MNIDLVQLTQNLESQARPLSLESYRTSTELTHGLFRFPGRFHPPLVTYLIALHPEARTIGDPMVGSGTVAVEAVAAGRSGIYSDIDPLCCLLTRAKARPVDPQWLLQTIQLIVKKSHLFSGISTKRSEARKFICDLENSTDFRAPPDVFRWFRPYVVVDLCRALSSLADIECSQRRRDALLATFAGVIRRLSRADPSTSSGLEVTSVRRKVLQGGLRFNLAAELVRKATMLGRGYRELQRAQKIGKASVFRHDTRHWSALCRDRETWPDLVITSPCYISAIEYWRRHKLEYAWLGLVPPENLSEVKHTFLGMGDEKPELANLPKCIKDSYLNLCNMGRNVQAKVLARYFNDSRSWLNEVAAVLNRSNGWSYIIVGSNTSHGITLNTPLALQEIATSAGLIASIFMRYRIKNSFMQYPTKNNRIKVETVLELRSSS